MSQPDVPQWASGQPLWARQRENWAIEQERQRHDEALYRLGEYSLFFLMWSVIDFENGHVVRCPRCYGTAGSIDRLKANAYNQPSINRCPQCFGTTFDGGFRARIVRPAIWADVDESERPDRRGTVHPETASVESTWDFRMRQGDYIVRADGSRWRLPSSPRRTTLRSGFEYPSQETSSITYSRIQARLAEPETVAWDLPPESKATIRSWLEQVPTYFPRDFTAQEIIRGSLIPDDGVIE